MKGKAVQTAAVLKRSVMRMSEEGEEKSKRIKR
jgi:hypothetical protein